MKIKYIIIVTFITTFVFISGWSNQSLGNRQLNNDMNGESAERLITPSPTQSPVITQNLYKFPQKGIPVLMYHSIRTKSGNSLYVSEKQFKEEIEWLYSQNYHSITIEEFYQALVNHALLPEKPILITLDDGYVDNYYAAMPILKQYGFKATFFIIVNSVNNDGLRWEQIKDMISQGNSIGSHTIRHLDLATLSYEQQEREIKDSKSLLEEHLGVNIHAFCFPSGRYNKTTLELLKKSGYLLSFSTQPGKVHMGDDPYCLKRLRVSGNMSLSAFINLIS